MQIRKFDMNLPGVISLGIGSIVGAGIFALLGQVILLAGEQTYYAFIIAGIAAMFSGYSYARLAGRYHNDGGLSQYFHLAFPSKWISGSLTIIYMLTSAISISMMAKSFGIYATEFFDQIPPSSFWINSFAVGLIASMVILNMLGATDVGRSETILVAVKVIILLALIVAAFLHPQLRLSHMPLHPDNMDFLRSIGITFFAYAGYGVITNAAADIQNPQKNITRAIYLTLFFVMSLYIGLAYVVLNYTPGSELISNADTAVAAVARKLMGEWGYAAIYIAAVIAFISGINATFFSIFRINKSLAEQHILPHIYVQKMWRFGTWGNLLTATVIILATICFDFSAIVNLSSAAYLVSYLGIFAANWKLRKETASSPFVIILGTVIMLFILVTFIISLI